jgi:antitoxin component YwqK of YwqJK toxin-antitoxin module
MKFYSIISLIILTALIASCNLKEDKKQKENTDSEKIAIHRTYYEKSGALKSEITVKNNKKNGPAKKYYSTGELHTLVNYVDSKKEGKTIWYYRNGQAYRVTNYVNDKMHGIRKIYYEDGSLQAEIPYQEDRLIEGTTEYKQSGELIENNQRITFELDDYFKSENKFLLKIRLAEKPKKVEFFEEKISTEGTRILVPIKTNESNTGIIEYRVPKGSMIKNVVKIFATYDTKLGNPAMISKSYNLVIQNK